MRSGYEHNPQKKEKNIQIRFELIVKQTNTKQCDNYRSTSKPTYLLWHPLNLITLVKEAVVTCTCNWCWCQSSLCFHLSQFQSTGPQNRCWLCTSRSGKTLIHRCLSIQCSIYSTDTLFVFQGVLMRLSRIAGFKYLGVISVWQTVSKSRTQRHRYNIYIIQYIWVLNFIFRGSVESQLSLIFSLLVINVIRLI